MTCEHAKWWIETAVAAGVARGMVLIAAAGNAGVKSAPLYPAAKSERDRD